MSRIFALLAALILGRVFGILIAPLDGTLFYWPAFIAGVFLLIGLISLVFE